MTDPVAWYDSGIVAALLGAVIGGALTATVAYLSTRATVRAQSQALTKQIAEQRQQARQDLSVSAALDLLDCLTALEEALPTLHQLSRPHRPSVGATEAREIASEVLRACRRADRTAALLLSHDDVGRRWSQLCVLADELARQRTQDDLGVPPDAWSQAKAGRALGDVEAYLRYVRRSVIAIVDDNAVSVFADMPYLSRQDMSVWLPPDSPR